MSFHGEKMKKIIYLADLTHTGPVLSSNVHPLGVGLVGAYLLKEMPGDVEVELFKLPDDLRDAFERKKPDLVGFSNFSWNQNLSYEFARNIKKKYPEIPVVFGGPNYDMQPEFVSNFWQEYPLVDFYILREGEKAMADFVKLLFQNDWDVEKIKQSQTEISNCHYFDDGNVIKGDTLERIDISQTPSPYLLGLMDKFFTKQFIPIIQTTRGCPFKCTYCCDGQAYYTKTFHRTDFYEELAYIAKRHSGHSELNMSDPNFGMYKIDFEKAGIINEVQKKYDFPHLIHVSSGKNNQQRIIEVNTIVRGAIRGISAALQSTDPVVLKNIQRNNISQEDLIAVSNKSIENNMDAYTELILGLPGDSKAAHFKTVRDSVEANMGIVRLYQLIMLPNTEVNSQKSREKFELKTMHRLMQRSFGRYDFLGEQFAAVESEEISVSLKDMSFEDYLECRELDLTVEIFHNGRTFEELMNLCEFLKLSWFEFLLKIFNRRNDLHPVLNLIYSQFLEGTQHLWENKVDLIAHIKKHISDYLDDTEGTNEMARARSLSFFKHLEILHEIVFSQMKEYLQEKGVKSQILFDYLEELKRYSLLKRCDVINLDFSEKQLFYFDFISFSESRFVGSPAEYKLSEPIEMIFSHSDEQKEMIKKNIDEYGASIDGLSRIIMNRIHHSKLYRQPVLA